MAVNDGWSVRGTEDAVKNGPPGQDPITKPKPAAGGSSGLRPAGLLELENLLAELLETKVGVSMAGKRGRISIEFADLLDLERIYRRMAGESN
jgi:ParB family chromosome partitioning protein